MAWVKNRTDIESTYGKVSRSRINLNVTREKKGTTALVQRT